MCDSVGLILCRGGCSRIDEQTVGQMQVGRKTKEAPSRSCDCLLRAARDRPSAHEPLLLGSFEAHTGVAGAGNLIFWLIMQRYERQVGKRGTSGAKLGGRQGFKSS